MSRCTSDGRAAHTGVRTPSLPSQEISGLRQQADFKFLAALQLGQACWGVSPGERLLEEAPPAGRAAPRPRGCLRARASEGGLGGTEAPSHCKPSSHSGDKETDPISQGEGDKSSTHVFLHMISS